MYIKRKVYLDNASSTPIDKRVIRSMRRSEGLFANPSSIHKLGIIARNAIEDSRKKVAQFINSHTDEIIFTSGGTEGDNLAILGTIYASPYEKPHIIVSEIEHSAVISLVKNLEKQNKIDATYIKVDENGLVNPRDIRDAILEKTILISVHLVNNEIGTLEPIREIVKAVRHYKKHNNKDIYPIVHTDAAQATSYIEINVDNLGVDLLSFNGQKIYGPHGIGALYIKRSTPIKPVFIGGNQESGLRPGTEQVSQIVGLAKACQITKSRIEKDFNKISELRNYLISKIQQIPNTNIHAKDCPVSPHIISAEFENIPSETLVLYLDARGIYVSNKSACRSDDPNESYVLNAIKNAKIEKQEGINENGSIRFSLGRSTTKKDIDYVFRNLKEIIKKLNHDTII